MNKEYIQALEDLFGLVAFQGSFTKAQKYFDIIEEALNRLEAIDNANPSEALKYVNGKIADLEDDLQHYTMVDKDKCREFFIREDLKQFTNIKQALLKAQEPKQYLKWEDLVQARIYKVLLNGNQYEVVKRYDDYEYCCITLQKKPNVSIYIYEHEKEVFNDLRLERVE